MPEQKAGSAPEELRAALYSNLSPAVAEFVRAAAKGAAEAGTPLYLVGGAVRDLLLGYKVVDFDLVMVGDAVEFAEPLAKERGLRLFRADAYRNVRVDIPVESEGRNEHIDIVTARREMYPAPGQLPRTWPGTMTQDLARRDFSINAIALPLDPPGDLLDPFAGRADLAAKTIRVLHERSFRDDPTRIFRATRYEQRFGFTIERHTLNLIRNELKRQMIDALTADRVRHELERSLTEGDFVAQLKRLGELGVLTAIDPAMFWDERMEGELRHLQAGATRPGVKQLLAMLIYRLRDDERARAGKRLGLDRETFRSADGLARLEGGREALINDASSASEIDRLIAPVDPITINMAADSWRNTPAGSRLERWRAAPVAGPTLNGDDLKALGLPPGPTYREVLTALRAAVLDGQIAGREAELAFVRRWTQEHGIEIGNA